MTDDHAPATERPGLVAALGWTVIPLALLAFPIFLLAGLSMGGWLAGSALLVANRLIDVGVGRLLRGRNDVVAVGAIGFTMIGRAWLSFGALLGLYFAAGRDVALSATILFVVLFTVDIAVRVLVHATRRPSTGLPTGGAA